MIFGGILCYSKFMLRNGFAPITIVLIIAILLAFLLGYYLSQKPSSPLSILPTIQKEEVFAEKIPGSKFHSPDATWWGYNQSKIVRYKDKVFTYYVENDDDSNKTLSKFVILKKDGDKAFEEGAMFPTSRPGNLLIDSSGVLHAFVFEPFDVKTNDSIGKIIHYYFPNSATGDVKNYKQELVVDNDGKSETANIRVGAAISSDDTMAISFGLTKFNPVYEDQSEHIYFKKPDEAKWNHTFVEGLTHDFYYPFTLVSDNNFYLLPVQDDFNDDGNPKTYDNIYQKIMFMEFSNGSWKNKLVADLSNHQLAKARPRLLEQEDLYQDRDGKIHIIYKDYLHAVLSLRDKEFLNPDAPYIATMQHHLSGSFENFNHQMLKFDVNGINWVRLIEIEGKLYYLASSFDGLYIGKVGSTKLTEISIPQDAKSFYPYVATSKDGTKENNFVDILLLGADQKLFQEGKSTNYYIRIPKPEFTNLKN